MIKLLYIIARRPDLSPEAFHDYWLNTHGPLVRSHADALGARRYVQSHRIDTPLNDGFRQVRGARAAADGITELWWDDLDALRSALTTPAGRAAGKALAVDEAKFIDFTDSQLFLTTEHVIYDDTADRPLGPDAVKVVYEMQARADIGRAAAQAAWLDEHGPLVLGLIPEINCRRYVQSHTVEDAMNREFQRGRGLAEPAIGTPQLSWDSIDAFIASFPPPRGDEITRILVEDERRFADLSRVRCFLTREHVIFDRG